MIYMVSSNTGFSNSEILNLVNNFYSSGTLLLKGKRNEIKAFEAKSLS
jgi:hypothetical protein